MLNVYAESSAVLGWLLGEPTGEAVRRALARARVVVTSDLTLVECDRILLRRQAAGLGSEADTVRLHANLVGVAQHWNVMRLQAEVIDRARRPFPGEPIRTLDALHLASAVIAAAALGAVTVITLDARVRRAATALGLPTVPS